MKNFENLSAADRAELLGCLIDVVEDFLEEKGVLPEKDSGVIICGEDYDTLARRFSSMLGIQEESSESVTVYYTFGTGSMYPFYGGWVEVTAPSVEKAHALFRAYYPDKEPGVLNCADYYTEEQFRETDMTNGNFGAGCHKKLVY